MPELTIISEKKKVKYRFEGHINLAKALYEAGYPIQQPCGGRGVCGKCAVHVKGCISEPDLQERKWNLRLACRTELLGDAEVLLQETATLEQIETGSSVKIGVVDPHAIGYGIAMDIGTTTIAAKLMDLTMGEECAIAARINPQTAVASDVMGRISAALAGESENLKKMITDTLLTMIETMCAKAGVMGRDISRLVITGNTAMLTLLTGKDPEPLSHFPFEAECLFGFETTCFGYRTYFPICLNAFVGADITCGVMACGMTGRRETALLCDIGTNGEMALWKNGTLYVTSTAAGPAFEGAGISCGCGSIPGAIDGVMLKDDEIMISTIGDAPAVGICGSGLMDAVACLLKLGKIDETGAVEDTFLSLSNDVGLTPKDVRAVQLAKAAIAAGMITLMESAGVEAEEIHSVYIAGGFGSHLNITSAVAIGLIPQALTEKVKVIGNGALAGAQQMLMDTQRIQDSEQLAKVSIHIDLGGNPRFNAHYMEEMMFPEQ